MLSEGLSACLGFPVGCLGLFSQAWGTAVGEGMTIPVSLTFPRLTGLARGPFSCDSLS